MKRGMALKRHVQKVMKKTHNQAVSYIAETPEVLAITGLSSETLKGKMVSPKLRGKGVETGDLILLWETGPQEWEIFVVEVSIGARRWAQVEKEKLKRTFYFLKDHWKKAFQEMRLHLPTGYKLFVRMRAYNYFGKLLHETPTLVYKDRERIV